MNAELRKRLEEATEKYVLSLSLPSIERTYVATKDDFLAGAEVGYKEAIEQAKEWMEENTETRMPDNEDKDFVWVQGVRYEDKGELIARFETDMNKLWEEKK